MPWGCCARACGRKISVTLSPALASTAPTSPPTPPAPRIPWCICVFLSPFFKGSADKLLRPRQLLAPSGGSPWLTQFFVLQGNEAPEGGQRVLASWHLKEGDRDGLAMVLRVRVLTYQPPRPGRR